MPTMPSREVLGAIRRTATEKFEKGWKASVVDIAASDVLLLLDACEDAEKRAADAQAAADSWEVEATRQGKVASSEMARQSLAIAALNLSRAAEHLTAPWWLRTGWLLWNRRNQKMAALLRAWATDINERFLDKP